MTATATGSAAAGYGTAVADAVAKAAAYSWASKAGTLGQWGSCGALGQRKDSCQLPCAKKTHLIFFVYEPEETILSGLDAHWVSGTDTIV